MKTKEAAGIVASAVSLAAKRQHTGTVRGAGLGASIGAMVGLSLLLAPLGVALLAAAGAFVGTAAGVRGDHLSNE